MMMLFYEVQSHKHLEYVMPWSDPSNFVNCIFFIFFLTNLRVVVLFRTLFFQFPGGYAKWMVVNVKTFNPGFDVGSRSRSRALVADPIQKPK